MSEQKGGGATHEPADACARAADLVAYLYGESGPAEAQAFRLHLNACAHCRGELAAFGEVRARVGAWREEALSGAPALGLSGAFASEAAPSATPVGFASPTPAHASVVTKADAPSTSLSSAARARSARAALREFFALSPFWLRGATAAALLAFVGLAALTLARAEVSWADGGPAFRAGTPARTVTKVERVEVPASGEQVEALVRERVREELAAAERRRQEQAGASAPAAERAEPAPRLEQAASAPPARKRPAPRATSRGRRQAEDEESLPRLSDLLSGVY